MTNCPNLACAGLQYSLTTRTGELIELRAKHECSEAQVRELQAALTAKTSSGELDKAQARIRQYQVIDDIQRASLDRANEEVSYMRSLMQTTGYDMSALGELLAEHLAKTCGRAEAARTVVL